MTHNGTLDFSKEFCQTTQAFFATSYNMKQQMWPGSETVKLSCMNFKYYILNHKVNAIILQTKKSLPIILVGVVVRACVSKSCESEGEKVCVQHYIAPTYSTVPASSATVWHLPI